MRWAGRLAHMVVEMDAYNVLVVRPGGKRPLVKPKRRGNYNIKIDSEEIEWKWTGFIWLRIRLSGGLL